MDLNTTSMKTAYELAKEELKDFTEYPTGAIIIQLMLKYGELLANEYSNWLYEMDRLKLTNQIPPFETPEMITEYFLKAKIRVLGERTDSTKLNLLHPDVSVKLPTVREVRSKAMEYANEKYIIGYRPSHQYAKEDFIEGAEWVRNLMDK